MFHVCETKGFFKPVHLVTEGNSSIGVTFCGRWNYCSEKVIKIKGSDKRTASGGLVQTTAIILGRLNRVGLWGIREKLKVKSKQIRDGERRGL